MAPFPNDSRQSVITSSANYFKHYWRKKVFRSGNQCSKNLIVNDDEELDRQDVGHWIVKTAFGDCFEADISRELGRSGFSVLDVGCGVGTWSLEMASSFPKAHFTGIDIDRSVLPRLTMPKNSSFLSADITARLPFENESFDFIYWRHMIMALTKPQWHAALVEMHRVLKRGGRIEILEADYRFINRGPNTRYLTDLLIKSMKKYGLDPYIVQSMPSLLQKAGFKSSPRITEKPCPVGWNDGSGCLGDLMRELWAHSVLTFRPLLTHPKSGAMTPAEWKSEPFQSKLDDMFKFEFEHHATKEMFMDFVIVKT